MGNRQRRTLGKNFQEMRSLELSLLAEIRLQEIADYYIHHESVERTLKVVESFDQAFTKIASSPFSNKKFHSTEFLNLDIRIYSHFKTYHIYYVVSPETIRIAEIFHLHQEGSKLQLDL
jgi:plasmid stabilization system protein ParE